MRVLILLLAFALSACTSPRGAVQDVDSVSALDEGDSADSLAGGTEEDAGLEDASAPEEVYAPLSFGVDFECNGNMVGEDAVDALLDLSDSSTVTGIYDVAARIHSIASLFEACNDPWGLFPTTYRHITRRIIQAIEDQEIEDETWGRRIVLDFASRYFDNLHAVLSGDEPSYAWSHYYYLADRDDVSRTRAVVVAMVAHLTLDLPYALVATDSTNEHEDDYYVLGVLMIEIADDFIEELREHYDTDAEDILNGFFFGDWVDGAFGENTTMTLSYQTIRTKAWNNRWYLQQWWGGWIAEGEIYSAFWTIDGVLATLDAAGTI